MFVCTMEKTLQYSADSVNVAVWTPGCNIINMLMVQYFHLLATGSIPIVLSWVSDRPTQMISHQTLKLFKRKYEEDK